MESSKWIDFDQSSKQHLGVFK